MTLNENMKIENKAQVSFWQKFKNALSYIREHYLKFPGFILAHPIKGYDYFKREKQGKMSVAIVFIIILIIIRVLKFQYTGFPVSQNDPDELNLMREIGLVLFPIVLFTVSNWSITTLFDGKGKMREIFMMLGYAVFPMIWAEAIGLVFSNVITVEEVGFYGLIIGAGTFLTGYLIFFGLISIHEYGVLKCLGSIAGTVLAILVVLFVLLLAFDLFQQVYSFVYTIYREISLRYL
ncbi:MAG: YIP1 family protein [Bacilli bacterium]|nr:YIP1 family protein [Bacilli bacterium]